MPDRFYYATGRLLRKFRKDRKLSLAQAAALLNTSSPMLSRKERGQVPIERVDIRMAIDGYRLTRAEAEALWTSIGLVPDFMPPATSTLTLRKLASALLPSLQMPAFIRDAYWYVCAWNRGIEALWHPSRIDQEHFHVVDHLFSEQQRRQLDDRWESYVSLVLRLWYRSTRHLVNDPAYQELVEGLLSRHGALFQAQWELARTGATTPAPAQLSGRGFMLALHETPVGQVEYFLMQSSFSLPLEHSLIMYVPLGPLSQRRHEELERAVDSSNLYISDVACMDESG
jgi:transcriptional regulator with XRE-family HTH domain